MSSLQEMNLMGESMVKYTKIIIISKANKNTV
jgi:hypothetical protein